MKITKKMLAIAGLCIVCIFIAVLFTTGEQEKSKNKVNVTLTQEIVDDESNTNILNENSDINNNESATNSIVNKDKNETNDSKNINTSTNRNDSITTNNKTENDKTDNVNGSDDNQNSNNDKNYVETYVASEYELPTVFFD